MTVHHTSIIPSIITTFLISLYLITPTQAIGTCYTPGPSFPIPHLTSSQFNNSQIPTALNNLITRILEKNTLNPNSSWSPNTSSFSIALTSQSETLWTNHYTAPLLGSYIDGSPTPVTGDTVFRIASISKTFTVYALLLEKGIRLDDPITKFLPELKERDGDGDDCGENAAAGFGGRYRKKLDWDGITIRSLASQLSGLRRGNGNTELSVPGRDTEGYPDPVTLGFPFIATNDTELKPCMKNSDDRPCTASEIIKIARRQPPIFSPNDRSTYSNIAFSLLGLALENVTGQPFPQILESTIFKPLGMGNTSTSKPNDSNGIIPYGPNDWRQELGPDIPPIDLITKGGSLGGYYSSIILIPEFGIGLTILVAGAQEAQFGLREQVIGVLVPEVEGLVRDDARERYEGFYGSFDLKDTTDVNGKNSSWSISLEVDNLGPGLLVKSWISNKTDFLATYGMLKGVSEPEDQSKWEARLLPTNENWDDPGIEMWRLTAVPKRDGSEEEKVFDDYCFTDVDGLIYGGWSMEEFVFVVEGEERIPRGLEILGLRTVLWKEKNGGYRSGKTVEEYFDMASRLKLQGRADGSR